MRFEPHLALAMFDPFVLSCVACVSGRPQELCALILGGVRAPSMECAALYQRQKKLTLFLPFLCLTAETLRVSAFWVAVSTRSLGSLSPTAGRDLRFTPRRVSAILGAATGAAVAALIPANIRVSLIRRWY